MSREDDEKEIEATKAPLMEHLIELRSRLIISFPVVATQIYMFVAPGLYRHEKQAFLPYLVATLIFFLLGAVVVYALVWPMLARFSLSMQQAGGDGQATIQLLPKVEDYLGLMMKLIFAFSFSFMGLIHQSWISGGIEIRGSWPVVASRQNSRRASRRTLLIRRRC
jgi:Sec-independent protein secretion pathway component TatC